MKHISRTIPLERFCLALAFGAPLLLYVASLSPNVGFSDTGEMQTVPYILGIAHPIGSPLFTLGGWVFSHLLPLGAVAWRLSLLCALAMSIAACAVYALALELRVPCFVALGLSWLFAAGPVAWTYATQAELHAFVAMFALLSFTSALRLRKIGAPRVLYFLALCLGLGLASHPLIVLLLPSLLAIVWPQRALILSMAGMRACGIAVACLSLYLYLPLRSAYVSAHKLDPTTLLGLPAGQAFWDYGHPATWAGFQREVLAKDFDASSSLTQLLTLQAYADILPKYARYAISEYAPLILGLAPIGLAFVLAEEFFVGIGLALGASLTAAFALNYAHIGHIERYFLISFALIALCAAIAISRLSILIFRTRRTQMFTNGAMLFALVIAQAPLHRDLREQHDNAGAQAWIERVRSLTPPNALIIADWDYATPLAYASYVEHSLNKRIIQSAGLNEDAVRLGPWLEKKVPVYLAPYAQPVLDGYLFKRVDAGSPPLFRIERIK